MSETPAEPIPAEQSILATTKKALGIHDTNTDFDPDVIMYINSVLPTLRQLGVGPSTGYAIAGRENSWSELLGGGAKYNDVQSYIYMKVRMLFDPPGTSYHLNAMEEMIKEAEWRINASREETDWVNPNPVPETSGDVFGDVVVFDGGTG